MEAAIATDLERLVVQLEANMRNYERAMNRAVGKANTSARRIESRFDQANRQLSRGFQMMSRTAVGALGAIGVAVGGAQLGRFTMDSLAAAEAIDDTAQRVGFAVEQLQELRFAADQNGSSARTLDMALQRFSRRVGEAANGTGELLNSLEETGIELRNADGSMRDSYSILLDYADAIQNAESEQRALSLAFKAFDSEGASLVTLMRQGREGVLGFGQAARDAGVILEEGLVQQGAEANAALRVMRQEITTRLQGAVLENAEGLTDLAEAFADVATWAIEAAAGVAQFFNKFEDNDVIRETIEQNERLIERLSRNPVIGALNAARIQGLEAINADLRAQLQEQLNAPISVPATTRRMIEARWRLGIGGGDDPSAPGSDADTFDPYAGKTRPQSNEPTKGEALAAEKRAAAEVAEAQAEAYADALERRRSEFSSEFARTIAGGWMAAFDGNLAEFAAQRLRDALYDRLFTLFSELGRQIFDQMGGGGGILSTIGSAIFGGGRAEGGPVRAGTAYRVGERGPETIVPMQSGMVIPNRAAMRSGSGASVTVNSNYTIDARGATPDAVERLRAELPQAFAANNQRVITQIRAEVPGIVVRARKDGVL